MSQPIVSIIIPIYKTEKYLFDCLRSVQCQSMQDFEAILVNDCTPDGSMQIARSFAQSDSRFRIVQLETNQGPGVARNEGVAIAQGEYLNFLDSDDRLPVDALQIMLELVEKNNTDMVIGNMAWLQNHRLSSVKYIDRHIRSWSYAGATNLRCLPEDAYLSGSVCHRLIKKQIFENNNIKFPEHVLHEDVPVTMEVWHYCARIVATPRFVYFRTRREDPENLSRTQTYNEKAFLDRDVVAQRVFNWACHQTESIESAARLGSVTLMRMFGTTKDMLDSAEDSIKSKITNVWFPMHTMRINNMINKLNRLGTRKET